MAKIKNINQLYCDIQYYLKECPLTQRNMVVRHII